MSTKFEKNMEDIFELPEKIEQTKELIEEEIDIMPLPFSSKKTN